MKILVAEDQKDISEMYKLALEARGHEVTLTSNGDECLQVYQRHVDQLMGTRNSHNNDNKESNSIYGSLPSPFDVVILDYRMPKKNGLEVAKQILGLVPRQRIVFASAYVRETLEKSVRELNQVVELLQKPFDPSVLIDTIEDREPYEGIKNLMINVKQVKDLDNPSEDEFKDLFDSLRKIQKGRIS